MHEKHHSGGPHIGLLLLVPVVAIAASKAMRHHRMMWEETGGPASATRELHLPPRLEWMLETWHTRAHQSSTPTDTLSA